MPLISPGYSWSYMMAPSPPMEQPTNQMRR